MKKDIIAVFAIVLLFAVLIGGTEFQSVEEYYLTHIDDITPESRTVFLSIRCDEILENHDKLDSALCDSGFVPSDGIILPQTEYVLREGDTVFDILSRVTRYKKLHMEYQGADKTAFGSVYVKGINHIYEFSCGAQSGWSYKVNGKFPDVGCSKYVLCDGDVIEWVYVCGLEYGMGGGGAK